MAAGSFLYWRAASGRLTESQVTKALVFPPAPISSFFLWGALGVRTPDVGARGAAGPQPARLRHVAAGVRRRAP